MEKVSLPPPFDITGLPLLVEEMMSRGFYNDEIRAIMGGNMKRFMLENLNWIWKPTVRIIKKIAQNIGNFEYKTAKKSHIVAPIKYGRLCKCVPLIP